VRVLRAEHAAAVPGTGGSAAFRSRYGHEAFFTVPELQRNGGTRISGIGGKIDPGENEGIFRRILQMRVLREGVLAGESF